MRPRTGFPRHLVRDGLFVVVWLPYALLVRRFWFVIDDAFISFRYARHWAEGHGLRYNLGEIRPEEGYTNFLWVAACAALERLGGDPVLWAPLLSFSTGSVLLYLVYRALLDDLGLDRGVALLTTFSLGVFPPFALWSTGGLATMPFALAFFVTFRLLALRPEGMAAVAAGLCGAALALLRFEGLAWALVIGAVSAGSRWLRRQPVRPVLRFLAIVIAVHGTYFAWRYGYHGHLFPNSVYAKVHFNTEVALRGALYVASCVVTCVTPLLLLPTPFVALRRPLLPVGGAVLALAVAVPTYSVVVGGDWMPMWRFLVPGLAMGALLLGWLLQLLWMAYSSHRRLVAAAVLAASGVAVLPAWNQHAAPEWVRRPLHFRYGWVERTEYEVWSRAVEVYETVRDEALALREVTGPDDSIIADSIGIPGYYMDLHIYDQFGLTSYEVARQGREGPLSQPPGLDVKVPRSYFYERRPTFLYFGLMSADDPEGRSFRERVIAQAENRRDDLGPLAPEYAPGFVHATATDRGVPRILLYFRLLPAGISQEPAQDEARWSRFLDEVRALPSYVRPREGS